MNRHEREGAPAEEIDGPSRVARLRSAIAHHPVLIGGPLIAVAIVAGFTDARQSSMVSLAAVVVFIVGQLFTLVHDDRLCLRCVAQCPIDPARAVQRRRRWLRLFHCATTTAGVAVLLVAAALGVTAGLLIRPGWGDLVLVLPLATMALTVVHRRIEPWCPYCGWGDDDGGEGTPEPSPDPDVAAPLHR